MPKGERKHYDKAFKLNAVYLMLSKTIPPKEIFQILNVDRQTVYRWVSEFKAHGVRRPLTKRPSCPAVRCVGCKRKWPICGWRTKS